MLIKALNNLDKSAQYTFLSTDVTASGTSLPIKNQNGFFANWAVQLGKTGEEQSEIKIATAVGTSLTVAAITYDHPTDTPVYAVKFDKLIFKRSTAGTAGTAVAMTDGTVSITPDSEVTVFDDTTGATTYAYKVSFYNSVTGEYSSDSDWLTPAGFSFYSLQKMRERVKNKLYSAGYLKSSDTQINDWINEWLEKMNNTAIDVNQDYSLGSVNVAHGTSGIGTITSTDFKEIRRLWFTTNGSDYFVARKQKITDFKPGETYSASNPYFHMLGDNVFEKAPTGEAGTANIWYYKIQSPLTNDTDEIPTSMKSYTKSFVDYALSQAYYLDDKLQQGQVFMTNALAELEKFKQEITPRGKTGPTYITMSDAISADDSYYFI